MSEEIYHEAIKALARAAHGHGRLEAPDGEARLDNPLCGDRARMQVKRAGGRIEAVAHEVKGCLLCRASAAVIGLRAAERSAEEIETTATSLERMLGGDDVSPEGWPELAAFAPVRAHRSRHGCVTLPFRALLAALRSGSA